MSESSITLRRSPRSKCLLWVVLSSRRSRLGYGWFARARVGPRTPAAEMIAVSSTGRPPWPTWDADRAMLPFVIACSLLVLLYGLIYADKPALAGGFRCLLLGCIASYARASWA